MTIGIYKLKFNGLEDWPYVGQSRNIEVRYKAHLTTLARGIGNASVLEAYEMCGPPELEILEECMEGVLNTREKYWINKLDSHNNGLNKTPGGDIYMGSGVNHYKSKFTKEQIVEGMKKLRDTNITIDQAAKDVGMTYAALYQIKSGITHTWFQEEYPEVFMELQDQDRRKKKGYCNRSKYTKEQLLEVWKLLQNPELTYIMIEDLTEVSKNQIYSIASGRSHEWLQEEFPKEYIVIRNINRVSHKTWEDSSVTLVSPEGEEFFVETGPTEFANLIGENKAFIAGISLVLNGKASQYKGWTRKDNPLQVHYLISPLKEFIILKEIEHAEFCAKNQVHRQSLSLLLANKQRTTKGFRLATDSEIAMRKP